MHFQMHPVCLANKRVEHIYKILFCKTRTRLMCFNTYARLTNVITTHLVTKAVSWFIWVDIAHPISSLLKSLSDNYGWLHYR